MLEPWVEKYRPNNLNDIVLSNENKVLIHNMIKKDMYPNMIFYGSPGTGKTTTILCLIKEYQKIHKCKNNYIHLNASHQRGIDVIRNEIQQFSMNKNFFNNHKKFVLLDEVDSMTKQAQNHLYYIIKNTNNNICYILICNYLNKIIDNIRNSLMILCFHNITNKSNTFLKKCIKKENINISKKNLELLKTQYIHDLRSIINFLQNYDGDKSIFIKNEDLKEICENKNPCNKIKKLNQYYELKHIYQHLFYYMYENYTLDIKLLKNMYFMIFINQDYGYFIHEFLPYFKLKNKLI